MELENYLETLDRDGRLLLGAVRPVALGTPVPSCPGWDVKDLLAHVGFVHRWAATYVAGALTEMFDDPDEASVLGSAPPGDEILDWFEEGHAQLVRVLSEAPPDLLCWSFLEAPSPLAFWARRQAHETCVHRVDAELAAGTAVGEIDSEFAADGIEELLLGFFGNRPNGSDAGAAVESAESPAVLGVIGLEAVDDKRDGPSTAQPLGWTVEITADRFKPSRGLGGYDALVSGPAAELYRLLWNRRPAGIGGLETQGDVALLELWRERSQVLWA